MRRARCDRRRRDRGSARSLLYRAFRACRGRSDFPLEECDRSPSTRSTACSWVAVMAASSSERSCTWNARWLTCDRSEAISDAAESSPLTSVASRPCVREEFLTSSECVCNAVFCDCSSTWRKKSDGWRPNPRSARKNTSTLGPDLDGLNSFEIWPCASPPRAATATCVRPRRLASSKSRL